VKRLHFGGLDEIRALAALLVLVSHVELYKARDKLPSLFDSSLNYFVKSSGKNGVYIFFCLSGFLITSLLYKEYEHAGTVSIKNFLIRRLLRIWPLYYFVMILSFFVLPPLINSFFEIQGNGRYYHLVNTIHDSWTEKLIYYFSFLSNLALKQNHVVAFASQSWSVSAEEQFYLIWPFLLVSLRYKFFISSILLMIFSYFLKDIAAIFSGNSLFRSFVTCLDFTYISIGCLAGAIFTKFRSRVEGLLNIPVTKLILFILAFYCLFNDVSKYIKGIIFITAIIANIPESRLNLRSKMLSYFGKMSYGIYMYHSIVVFSVFHFIGYDVLKWPFGNLYLYALIIGITVMLSAISYQFLELPFLRLKHRFGSMS